MSFSGVLSSIYNSEKQWLPMLQENKNWRYIIIYLLSEREECIFGGSPKSWFVNILTTDHSNRLVVYASFYWIEKIENWKMEIKKMVLRAAFGGWAPASGWSQSQRQTDHIISKEKTE